MSQFDMLRLCCFRNSFFRGMQNGSDGAQDKRALKRLPFIKRLNVTPRLPITTSSDNSDTAATPDAPPNKPPSATAAAKKCFLIVPNLSSSRNVPPTPKVEGAREAEGGFSRSKRPEGERRQWRERPKKEFIQSSSVFSDGVASQQMGVVTRSGLPVATSGAPSDASCGSKSGLKAEVVQEDSIDDCDRVLKRAVTLKMLFTNTCHKNARMKYKTLRLVAVAFTSRYSS